MELLVVMALMGILIGIAAPALSSTAKSRRLSHAAVEISGQIAIARTYALQNHCFVALVFPTMEEIQSISDRNMDDTYLVNYYNASCRPAIVARSEAGDHFKFVMWLPDSNWTILPKGTVIFDGAEDFSLRKKNDPLQDVHLGHLLRVFATSQKDKIADSRESGDDQINIRPKEDPKIERYLLFQPDGRIILQDRNEDGTQVWPYIRVTNAQFQIENGKGKLVKQKSASKKQVYLKIKVNPMTGKTSLTNENK